MGSVLATVGFAALAALGATGDLQVSEVGLCSMPASVLAERLAPAELPSFAARDSRPDWCTERDGMDDPRCRSEGHGQTPMAPAASRGYSPPEAIGRVAELPPRIVGPPSPPIPYRASAGRDALGSLFRPPRL